MNLLHAVFQFVHEVFIDVLIVAAPLQVLPKVIVWPLSVMLNVSSLQHGMWYLGTAP